MLWPPYYNKLFTKSLTKRAFCKKLGKKSFLQKARQKIVVAARQEVLEYANNFL